MGFTLVELAVALALAGVVTGVIGAVLVRQQRLYAAARAALEGRTQVAQALAIVAADLRALAPGDGDVTALAPDSLQFRATVGVAVACGRSAETALDVVGPRADGAAGLASWSSPPRPGDTLLVFDPGDEAADERWTAHAVAALEGGAAACANTPLGAVATPYYRVRVDAATPLPAAAGVGSAVRFVRHARFKLYAAGDGRWYLGYTDYRAGSGWATVQPVSGPYATPAGTTPLFRFYDGAGAELGDAGRAKLARVTIALRAPAAPAPARGLFAPAADSVDVAVRGARE